MRRWWWRSSLGRWRRCIRGELIWGWDALRAAMQTMRALRRDLGQTGDDFPDLLEELRGYLGPEKPGQVVKAIPGQNSNVPITLLGRVASARNWRLDWVCRLHSPRILLLSICMRRRSFYRSTSGPARYLRKPDLIVAVEVIAAETDAAARRLFTTPQQRFLRLIRNQPVELLPPVDSMEPLWQDWERAAVENKLRAAIVGSDATVKAGLENLVADTGADEVIAVTDTYEHADRLESYGG